VLDKNIFTSFGFADIMVQSPVKGLWRWTRRKRPFEMILLLIFGTLDIHQQSPSSRRRR
jgi:hypothetical protein